MTTPHLSPQAGGQATADTAAPSRDSSALADLTAAVVELGRVALTFGRIDRTAVYHTDGQTPESDTDHTVMLGWVACAVAARCFPGLDLGRVAQYALVHDAPEVYAGDTPTLRITAAGRAAKAAREHAALDRLRTQFGQTLPWFPTVIADYEAQHTAEARYVRALDKVLPKIVHLLDGGVGLVEQAMGAGELRHMCSRQRADMASYAAEFTEVLALHAALADQVGDLLTAVDPHTVPCGFDCGFLATSEAELDGHEADCDQAPIGDPMPVNAPAARPVATLRRGGRR